jgi:hypothetical protein
MQRIGFRSAASVIPAKGDFSGSKLKRQARGAQTHAILEARRESKTSCVYFASKPSPNNQLNGLRHHSDTPISPIFVTTFAVVLASIAYGFLG